MSGSSVIMAGIPRPDTGRWRSRLGALSAVVALLVVFPPFHVRRVPSADPSVPAGRAADARPETGAALDLKQIAEAFWREQLQPAASQAPDVATLAREIAADPVAASSRYGRRTGLGGTVYYFVRGKGRITALEPRGIRLQAEDAPGMPVILGTGPVFGNGLRDVTGKLDLNRYSSFDFNQLSTELNALSEATLQSLPGRFAVGQSLRFSGVAELFAMNGQQAFRVMAISIESTP